MVLGKLPVPGRPTLWVSVGQGQKMYFYPFSLLPLGVVGWCDGAG